MARIVSADREWHEHRRLGAAYAPTRWGQGPVPDPDDWSGRRVVAFISWGRWLVACPHCSSAQLAWQSDHRFCCSECGNLGDGWHRVDWPTNVEAIEAVLERRPHPATRNWVPGEVLKMLRDENIAHGIDPGRDDPADMQRALGLFRGRPEEG